MLEWVWALRDELYEAERVLKGAQNETRLARLSAPEHHELLRKERARLNFLSMDLISSEQKKIGRDVEEVTTSGGYDCWSVRVYSSDGLDEVRRSNIRQGIDALAEKMYGSDWVDRMLEWGEVQHYTDDSKPEGYNEWIGPEHKSVRQIEEEAKQRCTEMSNTLWQVLSALPYQEEMEALIGLLEHATPEQKQDLDYWISRIKDAQRLEVEPQIRRPRKKRRRKR